MVCDCVSDLKAFYTHHSADIPALNGLSLGFLYSREYHQVFDPLTDLDSVPVAKRDLLTCLQDSPLNPSHGYTADIR